MNSFLSSILGKPITKNWFFDPNSAFFTVTSMWLLYSGMIVIIVLAGLFSIPEDIYEGGKD